MIIILVAKKTMWIKLLLKKIGLLDKKNQYIKLKVLQKSKKIKHIKIDIIK